jgi:hypothetical protein
MDRNILMWKKAIIIIMTAIKKMLPIILLGVVIISAGCIGSSSPPTKPDENQNIPVNPDLKAKIVKISFDREDIIAGEKVSADLSIGNIGTVNITNETVVLKAKVLSLDDFLANLYLNMMSDEQKSMTYTLNFHDEIKPGMIAPVSAIFKTEKEMKGKSLAGTYEVTIKLYVNGQYADTDGLNVRLLPGNPRNIEPVSTPVPTPVPTFTPTPTPTIEITETPEPTPTPTPEPVVVATPTGNEVYSRVKADNFAVRYHQIYAGDAILWDNFDLETSYTYTIVELNGKLANITLPAARKVKYIFNTTGEYKFGLYYGRLKGDPSIQTIKVIANTTTNSTNAGN